MFLPVPLPSVKLACAAALESALLVADLCPGQTSPLLPAVFTDFGWIHGEPRSCAVTSPFFSSAAVNAFGVAEGEAADADGELGVEAGVDDVRAGSVVGLSPH